MKKSKKKNVNLHAGQRLRAQRISLGLTQDAVGQALGIASQQVQKYEKGINAMNVQRLCDFAAHLKVPVAYFFEGLAVGGGNHGMAKPYSATRPGGLKIPSDRESLEVLKSFKRIKDYGLRKRFADLLRSISIKNM